MRAVGEEWRVRGERVGPGRSIRVQGSVLAIKSVNAALLEEDEKLATGWCSRRDGSSPGVSCTSRRLCARVCAYGRRPCSPGTL